MSDYELLTVIIGIMSLAFLAFQAGLKK